jgi:undecaprenyl-diphosphatase
MTILETIIIAIVEGLTEFLPISSTAHMSIVRLFLSIETTAFMKSFDIIIQFGAILAVLVLYFRKIFSSYIYIKNLIIAFIPTGIIGFLLYQLIKDYLLGNILIISLALIIGGIIIILFEKKNKNKNEDGLNKDIRELKTKELLILGTAQALAVIPGVSRSGAVIISGRSLGLSKELITEFSFLLAIPTMFLAALYDIYKSGFSFSSSEWGTVGLGFLFAFIVALIVIKWFINYIKKNTFEIFGWYRIILGFIVLLVYFF